MLPSELDRPVNPLRPWVAMAEQDSLSIDAVQPLE
jgi:hypothetical protein